MNKKTPYTTLFTMLLIGLFVVTNINQAIAAAKPKFNDVVGNPFRQQIEEVTAAGLLSGYPNGQFKPNTNLSGNDGTITMLQLYITVVRGLGLEAQAKNYNLAGSKYKFNETVGSEFRGYLAMAADKKLLDAGQIANVRSDTVATRMNVATILATAFNISSTGNLTFADQDQVKDPHFRSLIAGIHQHGIMSGDSKGYFKFNASMTREEYAIVLHRLLNKDMIKSQRTMVNNVQLTAFDNNSITVNDYYSPAKKYSISSICPAYLDNKATTLEQLLNKQVDFYLEGDKVSYIRNSVNPNDYPGGNDNTPPAIIKESGRLDKVGMNNGRLEITIVKNSGNTATYVVDDNIKVNQNNQNTNLLTLTPNAYVHLELRNSIVQQISVEPLKEYRGIVTKVRNYNLQVEKSNGNDMEFSINEDLVNVHMDGKKYYYDDIEEGYEVKVKYSPSNEVLEIEVMDDIPRDLEGSVRSINYRNYEMTVDYKQGRKSFDVDEDVRVRGLVRKWEDVERNHQVKLEFYRDKVVEIEVIDSDSGEFTGIVTDIDSRRDNITIERNFGNKQTFNVNRRVDLEDIIIGSEVELTVRDAEVTRISIIDQRNITIEGEITSLRNDRIVIEQTSGYEFTFDVDYYVEVYDRRGKYIDYDDLKTRWEVELQLKRGDVVEINVIRQ